MQLVPNRARAPWRGHRRRPGARHPFRLVAWTEPVACVDGEPAAKTKIYAKAHLVALQRVAQPSPVDIAETAPC